MKLLLIFAIILACVMLLIAAKKRSRRITKKDILRNWKSTGYDYPKRFENKK